MDDAIAHAALRRGLTESCAVKMRVLQDTAVMMEIVRCGQLWVKALASGHKVLFAGNGGSAADAQHLAAELVGRFKIERHPLPALALTTDSSALTAIGNDYGFEEVFRRQLLALGAPGDVFVALSTSGNSPNILRACDAAQECGLYVVGLTGEGGGQLRERADLCVCVPSSDTAHIQETHITIGHLLCGLVDEHWAVASAAAESAA